VLVLRISIYALCLLGCACASVPHARTVPASKPVAKQPAELRRYRIDPAASSITATASAMLGRYEFRIARFGGTIEWAPREIERSRLTLEVDMTSVSGTVGMVTKIVRSEKFLHVERYPSASFVSAELSDDGDGTGRVRGVLSLRGVSRSIEVPGSFGFVGSQLRIQSEFTIDRRDYGIENDGALDALVADDVVVALALVARAEPATSRTPLRTP
jgi:polyisoprenoid-binding protein YceI